LLVNSARFSVNTSNNPWMRCTIESDEECRNFIAKATGRT
jgi:hypothetical protein